MTKGRRANPSTARDGFWFAQFPKQQIFPESLTATMQKQVLNEEAIKQIENRLPTRYKIRAKEPVNTFPFSVHDNKHCVFGSGQYLDSGLGVRKFNQEKCQHFSQGYFTLAHEPKPSSASFQTIYQTSFIKYPNAKPPTNHLGRFPKNHEDKCTALGCAAKNDYMWFAKGHTSPNNFAPIKSEAISSPEPKKHLPSEHVTE